MLNFRELILSWEHFSFLCIALKFPLKRRGNSIQHFGLHDFFRAVIDMKASKVRSCKGKKNVQIENQYHFSGVR